MSTPTPQQMIEFWKQVEEGKITDRQLSRLLARNGREENEEPACVITIDYSLSLEEMITAGKYDWANKDITQEHFPLTCGGTQQRELLLVFVFRDSKISIEQALEELGNRGLQPATIVELLALGAKHPELQRSFSIPALGSVWVTSDGRSKVPCLFGNLNCRGLSLDEAYDWRECILAVHK